MKTDNLIAALSEDVDTPHMPLRRAFVIAIVVGAVIAGVSFLLTLGPRPDFMQAIETVRFDFKFVVTLALSLSAMFVARDIMRPEIGRPRLAPILWIAPALLAVAILLELWLLPANTWMPNLIGHNMRFCVTMIPFFSLGPLVLILWVFRGGAPAKPARAGALAGLIAGGIGATFYAAHCFDDSPLFVAAWYSIAIGFVAALGALAGSRILRW